MDNEETKVMIRGKISLIKQKEGEPTEEEIAELLSEIWTEEKEIERRD